MDFPERLNALFKATGIKKNDLPEKIGVSRSMLFSYLAGRNEPPASFFRSVKDAFPWANIEWLITGIGEMESLRPGVHQVASGNGHIQVGGNMQGHIASGRGARVSVGEGNQIDVEQLLGVLADYVSPKILDEIKARLNIR